MIVGQEWGGYRNWPGWSGAYSTALVEIRWGVERVERGGRAALSPNLLVFWTIPGTLCTAGGFRVYVYVQGMGMAIGV